MSTYNVDLNPDDELDVELETAVNIVIGATKWGEIGGTISDQEDLQETLDSKANSSTLTQHTGDTDIHVTSVLKAAWNSAVSWITANGQNVITHLSDTVKHITASERSTWNSKADLSDIPTKTSELTNDSGFLTSHQSLSAYRTSVAQDTIDNGKVDKITGKGLSTEDYTTNEKTKLSGIANGAEVNVQPDWDQTNTSADDYIKNKPAIPVVPTNVSAFTNDAGYLTQHQSLSAYRTSAAQDIIDSGKESAIGSTHHIDGDYVDFDSSTTVNDKISVLSTQVDGKIPKSAQATKTSAMTSEVGIDANGKLWSAAGGGGGGGVDYLTVVNGEVCIIYEES